MAIIRENAKYIEKVDIIEFLGNPLISALPELIPEDKIVSVLTKLPANSGKERFAESSVRMDLLNRIHTVHVPQIHDQFIARSISRCIRWGYASRNNIPFSTTARVLKQHHVEPTQQLENYLTRGIFPVYGFSILGISGVGKTCSVLNALNCYPQVIYHTEYNDYVFRATQLVWLKVECPGDGSRKGLCEAILRQIDAVLGTSYSNEITSRISSDTLAAKVSTCLNNLFLGVLVIDDIQNLYGASTKNSELLSFLVYLMETLSIPVVMVGTPKVLPLFQQEFQMAKRATGEGSVRMGLMQPNTRIWKRYIETIWQYQYLRNDVPLTPDLENVFYEQSVGNPFLCSLLYKLVQDDAIMSREESFTVTDVRKVADEKLGITTKMRTNMLNGTDEELKKYEYLWSAAQMPIIDEDNTSGDRKKNLSSNKSKEEQLTDNIVRELVTQFQTDVTEACKVAYDSIAAKGIASPEETLGYAITLYKRRQKGEKGKNTPPS